MDPVSCNCSYVIVYNISDHIIGISWYENNIRQGVLFHLRWFNFDRL